MIFCQKPVDERYCKVAEEVDHKLSPHGLPKARPPSKNIISMTDKNLPHSVAVAVKMRTNVTNKFLKKNSNNQDFLLNLSNMGSAQ